MATDITILGQALQVTEVSKIAVTDIASADGTLQVRAIRIYGSQGDEVPPVLEIRLTSKELENLKIQTPAIKF